MSSRFVTFNIPPAIRLPYRIQRTLLQMSLLPIMRFHLHLPKRAKLNISQFFTPNPPSSRGLQTWSHLTHAILEPDLDFRAPSQKKFSMIRVALLSTPLGARKNERKNNGNETSTLFMRHNLSHRRITSSVSTLRASFSSLSESVALDSPF